MYDTASRVDHNDYFINSMASKSMPAQVKAQENAQVATPMSPHEAQDKYAALLTPYEMVEITSYPEVYYVGREAAKVWSVPGDSANNYGYDNPEGAYTFQVKDHIAYRYEYVSPLGDGSFGQCVKAYDHKYGKYVALKMIKNKPRLHDQALIELRTLKKFDEVDPDHSNHVIHMRHHFYFRQHLCIVFDLQNLSLYDHMEKSNFQGLPMDRIRYICEQILQSLVMLEQHSIIHCDLKPENILYTGKPEDGHIKVIDFGSSCATTGQMFMYIQSRFYRAPEVVLGFRYDCKIDMWSLACILAELLTGEPIFPGRDEEDQMACIMSVIGPPPPIMGQRSPKREKYFDVNGIPLYKPGQEEKRRPQIKHMGDILKCNDGEFLDFLERCFVYDPKRRMSPREALRHPWISQGRGLGVALAAPFTNTSSVLLNDMRIVRKPTQQQQQSVIGQAQPEKQAEGGTPLGSQGSYRPPVYMATAGRPHPVRSGPYQATTLQRRQSQGRVGGEFSSTNSLYSSANQQNMVEVNGSQYVEVNLGGSRMSQDSLSSPDSTLGAMHDMPGKDYFQIESHQPLGMTRSGSLSIMVRS